MPFLFTFDSSFSSDTSIATLELNSFKISNLSFLSHCFTSNYSRWVFPLFLLWFFSSMGLWLICFRCVYPCFIGFPCASFFFFYHFLISRFTIPVQFFNHLVFYGINLFWKSHDSCCKTFISFPFGSCKPCDW